MWPDWVICESSYQQVFSQRGPKYFVTFWTILKNIIKVQTYVAMFWTLSAKLGNFLIQHPVTLPSTHCRRHIVVDFELKSRHIKTGFLFWCCCGEIFCISIPPQNLFIYLTFCLIYFQGVLYFATFIHSQILYFELFLSKNENVNLRTF